MSTTATLPTLKKTAAELALAERFNAVLASLPGGEGARTARRAAMAAFSSQGLPHRRIEEWKYTDLRSLIKTAAAMAATPVGNASSAEVAVEAATFVFVDGKLTSAPAKLPTGVTVETLAKSLAAKSDALSLARSKGIDAGAASILALNTAFASDGASIRIADAARPEQPIHLLFVSTGITSVRNRIAAGARSEATIIETHLNATGDTRQEIALCEVAVGDDAVLHHVSRVETAAGAVYLGHVIAEIGKASIYRPFQLSIADGLVRQQHWVTFNGEAGSFDFAAATLARGSGHGDTTMTINHVAPGCTSRELFKTVLDDHARAIFQGKVIVDKDAQKTDGKQMARALMLSPDTEFDSKPELEIYADDVACGHGSTCMELDPDLVFYCRSRGIPEAEARALLIDSFIGEAIDKVEAPDLRRAMSGVAEAWLRQTRRSAS